LALGALPRYRPQLATLVRRAPEGDEWAHEIKLDGYRIGCFVDGRKVRLESRREIDWTARFPEVERAAKKLNVRSAILDGEVAIVMPDGRTSFQALQNSFTGAPHKGVTYFAFDLLWLDGRDLTGLPLRERKLELERVLGSSTGEVIRYSAHVVGNGRAVFAGACQVGAEGIVSKRLDGRYLAGRREGWLKTKCTQRQEFVIGGFTEPEGTRAGIGALLLGVYEGDELVFAGKVGTGPGFTAAYLTEVRRALQTIAQERCPYAKRPPTALTGRNVHWVRPVLVGEVEFVEWTDEGSIRHPSFQGFRTDKNASDVRRERPAGS